MYMTERNVRETVRFGLKQCSHVSFVTITIIFTEKLNELPFPWQVSFYFCRKVKWIPVSLVTITVVFWISKEFMFSTNKKKHMLYRVLPEKILNLKPIWHPLKKPDGTLVFSCKVINLLAMEKKYHENCCLVSYQIHYENSVELGRASNRPWWFSE